MEQSLERNILSCGLVSCVPATSTRQSPQALLLCAHLLALDKGWMTQMKVLLQYRQLN